MTVTIAPTLDSPTADVPDLGTVLGVWAHPDDEAYLSAGLMLHAREAHERVVVVTATDGEQGTPSPTTASRRRPVRACGWRRATAISRFTTPR